MPKYQVIFFQKINGDAPAEDFLNSLDEKMGAKMTRLLLMVSDFGPELRGKHSKHLEDGIFELREQFGSNISRVLYFFYVGGKVILTNGFIKKHRKRPEVKLKKQKLTAGNM